MKACKPNSGVVHAAIYMPCNSRGEHGASPMSSLNSKVVQKAVQKRSRNDENHDQEELKQLYDRHGMIKCPIWHRDMPRNNVAHACTPDVATATFWNDQQSLQVLGLRAVREPASVRYLKVCKYLLVYKVVQKVLMCVFSIYLQRNLDFPRTPACYHAQKDSS